MEKTELRGLFALAIRREVEAYDFYSKIAESMENEEVREIFRKLATEELGHKALLEKFESDPTVEMKFDRPPVDLMIAESTELPRLTMDMKPADAIALAMKKEQQACEFYRKMADGTTDEGIRKAFLGLADMELGHKARLENAFVEMGFPEVF